MDTLRENILAALAYFDVFSYPLTREELYLFSGKKCTQTEVADALNYLLIGRQIYRFDKFYTLRNDQYVIERRIKGNEKAAELIATARKIGHWLIRFPYVRGIAISGSLSKNFADEEADIDFFVITAKNRLWIARTLMHGLKKLAFLINKQDYLCMNYFIDEQALQIPEKNIYTATEVVTLIPLEGDIAFERFFAANSWTRGYLPNNFMRLSVAKPERRLLFKRFMEWLFNNNVGNMIDDSLMRVTNQRWLKKTAQQKRNVKGIVMALQATKHAAKPEPEKYQQKLIGKYEDKLQHLLIDREHSIAN